MQIPSTQPRSQRGKKIANHFQFEKRIENGLTEEVSLPVKVTCENTWENDLWNFRLFLTVHKESMPFNVLPLWKKSMTIFLSGTKVSITLFLQQ